MIHEPYTVVLIEDTLDDEQLALRALRGIGLPLLVRVARDGVQGLHLLGLDGDCETAATPDLIICDIKMPRMNGDEVLRRARACDRLKGVPFVIFSSSDEAADQGRCRALGASDYVTKPVDFEQYLERVKQIAQQWIDTSAPRPTFCTICPSSEVVN